MKARKTTGARGPRQNAALHAIRKHWRAFGEAPTRAELGDALKISRVSAHLLVRKLERDGLVVIEPFRHRNVRPWDQS